MRPFVKKALDYVKHFSFGTDGALVTLAPLVYLRISDNQFTVSENYFWKHLIFWRLQRPRRAGVCICASSTTSLLRDSF